MSDPNDPPATPAPMPVDASTQTDPAEPGTKSSYQLLMEGNVELSVTNSEGESMNVSELLRDLYNKIYNLGDK